VKEGHRGEADCMQHQGFLHPLSSFQLQPRKNQVNDDAERVLITTDLQLIRRQCQYSILLPINILMSINGRSGVVKQLIILVTEPRPLSTSFASGLAAR